MYDASTPAEDKTIQNTFRENQQNDNIIFEAEKQQLLALIKERFSLSEDEIRKMMSC